MTIRTVTAADAGCWIDGHLGHYISAEVIRVAVLHGWNDLDALRAAEKYFQYNRSVNHIEPTWTPEEEGANAEFVYEVADEAVRWMNENVAPEGYSFGFFEGEFFLWANTQWNDDWEPEPEPWTPGEPTSGPFKASDA